MLFGICNLSIIPVRLEPNDTAEMVTQGLFGEHFKVLEKRKKWSKIRFHFDKYEGYIDNKQYQEISEDLYTTISEETPKYTGELIDFVTDQDSQLTTVSLGSRTPFYKDNTFSIRDSSFIYEGKIVSIKQPKEAIVQMAFLLLNTPYLWGGKTPFGIDCSGFTQLMYKLCGHSLLRDASQQATQGEVLSFIEESEPGDLAFFDNAEGAITHVGIIMDNYRIIHAHGKVRIDQLDHTGIYNIDSKRHTHKLRVIKKII